MTDLATARADGPRGPEDRPGGVERLDGHHAVAAVEPHRGLEPLPAAGRDRLEGGRGIAAIENLARVIESHLADGGPEDILSERHGLFRRPVHADYELVDLRAVADQAQRFFHGLQRFGHEDLDRLVQQESVDRAGLSDGVLGADLEGLLKTGTYLGIAQSAHARQITTKIF